MKGFSGEPSAKELRNYYGYIRSRSDRTTDEAMSPIWSGTIKQSHLWKVPRHRQNSLNVTYDWEILSNKGFCHLWFHCIEPSDITGPCQAKYCVLFIFQDWYITNECGVRFINTHQTVNPEMEITSSGRIQLYYTVLLLTSSHWHPPLQSVVEGWLATYHLLQVWRWY